MSISKTVGEKPLSQKLLLEFTSGNQHDNIEHNLKCTDPVAKAPRHNAGSLGSTPGQGTGSHVPQLRSGAAKYVNKTNKYIFFFFFLKLTYMPKYMVRIRGKINTFCPSYHANCNYRPFQHREQCDPRMVESKW